MINVLMASLVPGSCSFHFLYWSQMQSQVYHMHYNCYVHSQYGTHIFKLHVNECTESSMSVWKCMRLETVEAYLKTNVSGSSFCGQFSEVGRGFINYYLTNKTMEVKVCMKCVGLHLMK